MNGRLFLLELWLPARVRRRMFGELVRLTAESFDADLPPLAGLPPSDAIDAFGRFTRAQVARALAMDAAGRDSVRARLHDRARDMGSAVRRRLHIATRADAFRALRLLYAGIGIDLETDARSGGLTVRRCAFSGAYTPEVCTFISALDAGIVAGITGGATLRFSERITEGAACCRALAEGSRLP